MDEYTYDIIVSVDAPDDETAMRINEALVAVLPQLNQAAGDAGATRSGAELHSITNEDTGETLLDI